MSENVKLLEFEKVNYIFNSYIKFQNKSGLIYLLNYNFKIFEQFKIIEFFNLNFIILFFYRMRCEMS